MFVDNLYLIKTIVIKFLCYFLCQKTVFILQIFIPLKSKDVEHDMYKNSLFFLKVRYL